MHALIDKLRQKGLWIPRIALKCFHSQVGTILAYGVQVWGPEAVLRVLRPPGGGDEQREELFERAIEDRMVDLHRSYLRSLAGVKVASNRLLFREFGERPLQIHWAKLILRFWNKLASARGTIHHHALREEVRLALATGGSHVGWGSKVLQMLRLLGFDFGVPQELNVEAQVDIISTTKLDVSWLISSFAERMDADWRSDRLRGNPRLFVSDGRQRGVQMCRHERWMGMAKHLGGIHTRPALS